MPDYAALEQLEPKEVFARFAEICRIPHGSGNEKALSDFFVRFAREHGLEAVQDKTGSVLIRKPASPGLERLPGVILQAHMDMVCVKEPDHAFDFARQGIAPVIDGDWIKADRTTLGADNGIGVAYALALLTSALPLPPLEAVFTTSEETGMNGAIDFDVSLLKGTRFINLDSEHENIFIASCAGGVNAKLTLPVAAVPARPEAGDFHRIEIAGLKGGHSGIEIDKQRGNAFRLLGRVLDDLSSRLAVNLADIRGGIVSNAIPAAATMIVQIPKGSEKEAAARLKEWRDTFARELRGSDEQPELPFEKTEAAAEIFAPETFGKILFALNALPHGIEAMDLNIHTQRLVETSSNFALIRREDGALAITVSIRSSLESKKAMLLRRHAHLAKIMGAEFSAGDGYPGWTYSPESPLRDVFRQAYANLNPGKEFVVEGVHAGLECGLFARSFAKIGRTVDMISFGPDIRGAHSPEEKASISSTVRVWELLKEGLGVMAERGG